MKFNLDTAWKDASRLLSRNLGLLAVVAGVFFFLPYAGVAMALPRWAICRPRRPAAIST